MSKIDKNESKSLETFAQTYSENNAAQVINHTLSINDLLIQEIISEGDLTQIIINDIELNTWVYKNITLATVTSWYTKAVTSNSEVRWLVIVNSSFADRLLKTWGFTRIQQPMTGENFTPIIEGRYVDGFDTCQLQACIVETISYMRDSRENEVGWSRGIRKVIAYRHGYTLTDTFQKVLTKCMQKVDREHGDLTGSYYK